MPIVIAALMLSGANLLGYVKCSNSAQDKVRSMVSRQVTNIVYAISHCNTRLYHAALYCTARHCTCSLLHTCMYIADAMIASFHRPIPATSPAHLT